MPNIPTDLPEDQLQRLQQILDQVLANLRRQSRDLPPDAGLALTYELQPEPEK